MGKTSNYGGRAWEIPVEKGRKEPVCFLEVAQSTGSRYNGRGARIEDNLRNLAGEGGCAVSSRQFVLPRDSGGPAEHPRLLYVTCAQYSAEWNSTLHTHACAELFFITGGHGVFQVQGEGFPVAINDMVAVNTGVPHTETSQNGSPMEYVVLGVEGLEPLTGISGYTLLHLTGQDGVSPCVHMLVQEARGGQPGWGAVCQRVLEILLLRRGELSLSETSGGRSGGPRASRECDMVRRYIDNHFKENLTLDQLAALVHINKYYLSHAFRKHFQCSPHQLPDLQADPGELLPAAGDRPDPVADRTDLGIFFSELFLPELPAAEGHESHGVPQAPPAGRRPAVNGLVDWQPMYWKNLRTGTNGGRPGPLL